MPVRVTIIDSRTLYIHFGFEPRIAALAWPVQIACPSMIEAVSDGFQCFGTSCSAAAIVAFSPLAFTVFALTQ